MLSQEDHSALAIWAAACAERVLRHFAEAQPDDDRPRAAIESARSWARGDLAMTAARKAAFASHAAARETKDKAAMAAARAAGHAAATAHVATHATYAADYAVKAATEGGADAAMERAWQAALLPGHLRQPPFAGP